MSKREKELLMSWAAQFNYYTFCDTTVRDELKDLKRLQEWINLKIEELEKEK